MKISIIIPTYKPQEYFWECLKSIKDQTFDKNCFEVIVILNGPKYPYQKNIDNYINKELTNIKVYFLYSEVLGVSNARNTGLDHCKGEYISFVDDDDIISSTYLEEMYEIAITGKLPLSNMIAFDDITKVRDDNHYIHQMFIRESQKGDRKKMQVRSYFSTPCAKLIPLEYIGTRRFDTNFSNGEDSLFMYSISDKIDKLKFTSDKAIYFRRMRVNSAVTKYRSKVEKVINLLHFIMRIFILFFKHPFKYDLIFTLSRIAAGVYSIKNAIFN